MTEEQVRAIVRDELAQAASQSRQAFWDNLYASFNQAERHLQLVGDTK